ncbi:MAG: amidohydrolase [Clostridia bacterium]|nr:amidohydrolase [Clostridia bacterium]
MKERYDSIEKHRRLMFDALDHIWRNPETGYKEWKTHEYLVREFEALGYGVKLAGNIPGFTALADTGVPGPTVAVFGELDSLICETHPEADNETGAVHACGHCAQSAALLGLAAALKEDGAMDGLCGKILLVAVPAEELIEVEFREELVKKGVIRYMGGKPEFMHRGLLDGVDMAFMVHTASGNGVFAGINGGSNGCLAKSVCFEGVASHAGGAPHRGVNALYAANLAMNAINALRETFEDEDHTRVHPIVTFGGDAVNAIPETVKLESYVRGARMEKIVAANRKINRAISASAAALGANVRIKDIPGYWPRRYSFLGCKAVEEAFACVVDDVRIDNSWEGSCSDMGDVGAVMPALHPYISGATGKDHGNDYRISDPETACVTSAKAQYALLRLLLSDNAKRAWEIVEDYKPNFATVKEYFDYIDGININCRAVTYGEGNRITLDY